MIELLLVFLANFCFIFLKAFQQQNVIRGNWWWVIPTSNLMAIVEVYVVAYVALSGFGWQLVLTVGMGGGLGCLASMWLHRRFNNVNRR